MGTSNMAAEGLSHHTITYGFIANYLVWVAMILVVWMAFCPLLSLRRGPARVLNWMSRKVGLTSTFKLTTVMLIVGFIMLAMEYISTRPKTSEYYKCKEQGTSITSCDHQLGQKWRAERNLWLVGFNLLCWVMVDRLAERIKMEEDYSSFLAEKKLETAFASFCTKNSDDKKKA